MHIHSNNLHPGRSLNGAEATLAARRAEQTRKKLLASASFLDPASGLDQGSTPEGALMVGAWAGNPNNGQNPLNESPPQPASTPAEENAVKRSPASAAVNYWA